MMKAVRKRQSVIVRATDEDSSISSEDFDSDSFDDVNEFDNMSELPIEPTRSFKNYHEEQRLMTTMAEYSKISMTQTFLERKDSAHNLPHYSK